MDGKFEDTYLYLEALQLLLGNPHSPHLDDVAPTLGCLDGVFSSFIPGTVAKIVVSRSIDLKKKKKKKGREEVINKQKVSVQETHGHQKQSHLLETYSHIAPMTCPMFCCIRPCTPDSSLTATCSRFIFARIGHSGCPRYN